MGLRGGLYIQRRLHLILSIVLTPPIVHGDLSADEFEWEDLYLKQTEVEHLGKRRGGLDYYFLCSSVLGHLVKVPKLHEAYVLKAAGVANHVSQTEGVAYSRVNLYPGAVVHASNPSRGG